MRRADKLETRIQTVETDDLKPLPIILITPITPQNPFILSIIIDFLITGENLRNSYSESQTLSVYFSHQTEGLCSKN